MSRVFLVICVGLLWLGITSSVTHTASTLTIAQDATELIFTNDANRLQNVSTLKDTDDLAVFTGADAVYGVLKSRPNISRYTTPAGSARVVRVVWSTQRGNWHEIATLDLPLTREQERQDYFTFTLIPPTLDPKMPGLEDFLSTVDEEREFVFKVRIESEDGAQHYIQSGFIIDLKKGLGRYGEWADRREAESRNALAEKEARACAADAQAVSTAPRGGVHSLAFSPDGRLLASGRADGTTVWDFLASKESANLPHPGSVWSIGFNSDGSLLATAAGNACVEVWDVGAKKLQLSFKEPGDKPSAFRRVGFGPDNKSIVTSTNRFRRWNASTGELELTSYFNDRVTLNLEGDFKYGSIAMAVSPNGKTIAIAPFVRVDTGLVSILETSTFDPLGSFQTDSKPIVALAYSPDGMLLAGGHSDGNLRVWDLATATELQKFRRQAESISSVAFSPDSATMASASEDMVVIWDVKTGKDLQTLKAGTPVNAVAFSPDGKSLVSGGANGLLTVWDPATGKLVRRLPDASSLIVK